MASSKSVVAHARIAGLRASKLYKPTSGVGAGLGVDAGLGLGSDLGLDSGFGACINYACASIGDLPPSIQFHYSASKLINQNVLESQDLAI